uniref:Large ribosomal subunit protein uL23c n=1 Tax=Polysiphonia sertularioides TaxID=945028 RepID=A0A1Z1M8V5_9FLOR|nr:ribosomal protein L23 [Polysiphonia sertularioides]ARW62527.1 ribosomal protein L23 [Polysiphonia sertularioides]
MTKSRPEIIRYPIVTDKATKYIENNVYYFSVNKKSCKTEIKKAIEDIFDVKVKKINTINSPPKTKTIGRFKGKKSVYKKAIIKLHENHTINLFNNEE